MSCHINNYIWIRAVQKTISSTNVLQDQFILRAQNESQLIFHNLNSFCVQKDEYLQHIYNQPMNHVHALFNNIFIL